MSLTLDLKPEVENALREYAKEEGVSISDLLARTFAPRTAQASQPQPKMDAMDAMDTSANPNVSHQAVASQIPRKAPRLQVLPREQAKALNAPSIARLQAQLAEGAKATPEEATQAEAEWQDFKQAMNANRSVTGERLLFPDTASVVQP